MDKNSKKIKIGIIHTSMDVIGGAEKTTFCLLEALKKTDYDVTIYTTTEKLPINNDFKIKRVKRESFPLFWKFQRSLEEAELLELAKNKDVVIIMSGGLVIGKFKTKTLVYCHSFFNAEHNFLISNDRGLLHRAYNRVLKKEISQQFERLKTSNDVYIISNSEYTASKIKQSFSKNSIIINPPVNLSEFTNQKDNRDGVITVSRYAPEKNLDFAISVMKNVPAKYKLIGNATFESQKKIYEYFIKICKNRDSVELFCNINRDSVLNHLQKSKVYFHTSEETFGISVVESIAAGCIPIVPDNSAHKETVPFEELRYSENNSTDAKNKLERAINGDFDSTIKQLQDSIKKFSKEKFQQSFLDLIEELIKV